MCALGWAAMPQHIEIRIQTLISHQEMKMVSIRVKGIDETAVSEFAAGLRGVLLRPGHEGYDEARKVYNAMIDKRPGYIVKCADVADVIQSVNFARENNLSLAVRGGGHNGGGLGICDDGLVIDLSGMK